MTDKIEALERLVKLADEGRIIEAEYRTLKAELLAATPETFNLCPLNNSAKNQLRPVYVALVGDTRCHVDVENLQCL